MTSEPDGSNSAIGSEADRGSPAPRAPIPLSERTVSPKTWGKWVLISAIIGLSTLLIVQRVRHSGANGNSAAGAPRPADAQAQRSLQLYQAGRYQESVDAGKEALRLDPNKVSVYTSLAVAYLQLKNYDQALANINVALRLQPNSPVAQSILAWILREQANPTASAAPSADGGADFLIDLSLKRYQAGEFQESIEAAEAALQVKPGMAEAYNNISAACNKLEMWDKAIVNAQLALKSKPDFGPAKGNLDWALFQKSQIQLGKKAPKGR